MRICFIAPANSAHIEKWCHFFVSRGHEVHVISFTDNVIDKVHVHYIDCGVTSGSSDLRKIKYLIYFSKVKKIINEIHPDIVNAHYATSYGSVAAFSGISNYIVSVWGADIYDFPKKSIFHRVLLKYSLNHASYIFSTSKAMAGETNKYTSKNIFVTPFGVDTNLFSPAKRTRTDGKFVIGTVKALTYKYGIDYLLKAVADFHKILPKVDLELRIAGKGSEEGTFRELANQLGISDITHWLGFISQEEAAREWANMDVAVIPSTLNSESFGVSAVEAQACGVPVIIADIPGLMEATCPGRTSIVVPRKNAQRITEELVLLYNNKEKRIEMGRLGRCFVEEAYEYSLCFEKIETLFSQIKQGCL